MSNDPSSPQNFNIGRDLSIIGDLTIGQKNVFYTLPPLPPPDPAELEAAVTQLEQIPLQQIPAVAPNLPAGSTLPLPFNKHFVGRDEQFRQLAQVARQGGQAAVFAQAGLTGAGGIGKTQLAVEFAHRYGRYFAGGVFWLNCANPDLLSTEIAKCAQNKWADIPYANEVKTEEWVKRLKNFWGNGWPCLVILDNCEEEKVVAEVAPTSGRVCLLITSRKSNWQAYNRNIQAIPLEVLARPDSQQLLQGLAPHLTPHEANQIAEQLGDFPLALELAGHYLHALSSSGFELPIAEYLAKLEAEKMEHESLKGWNGLGSLTNHEMNVYATFSLSYEQLHAPGKANQLAEQLIQYLAFFAPQAPIALAWCHPLLPDTPPMMWNQAMERLLALGLVERPEPGQVQMHRLVMYFVQGEIPEGKEPEVFEKMVEVVIKKAEEINKQKLTKPFYSLLPHIEFLISITEERKSEMARQLCNNLGYHHNLNTDYILSNIAFEKAFYLSKQIYGSIHSEVATHLNNLGQVQKKLGNFETAKLYTKQALQIDKKVHGTNHENVARDLNNLGLILKIMRDFKKAKVCAEFALKIDTQIYGINHPKIAVRFNTLGGILQAMGEFANAKTYFEQALQIEQKKSKFNTPQLAVRLNNLGGVLQDMGDSTNAKIYIEQALQINEEVYGTNHLYVAINLYNLGDVYKSLGDLTKAEQYIKQALTIYNKVLGKNHPDTQMIQEKLAFILQKLEEQKRAS
jgi:tetratricopeptide (TPR) repeat protein